MTDFLSFGLLSLAWAFMLYNIGSYGSAGFKASLLTLTCTVGLACMVLGPALFATDFAVYIAMASGVAFGLVHFNIDGSLPKFVEMRPTGKYTFMTGSWLKISSLVWAIFSFTLVARLLT